METILLVLTLVIIGFVVSALLNLYLLATREENKCVIAMLKSSVEVYKEEAKVWRNIAQEAAKKLK